MDDVHFLERLARVSWRETDLALSLYRDPELVRTTLDLACPPDGAERVALALGDGDDGPWIIVARADGAFVTCLAAGMTPDPWPRVPHSAVVRASIKLERLRAALGRAREAGGASGPIVSAFIAMIRAGADVTREDVATLLPILPLVADIPQDFLSRTRKTLEVRMRSHGPRLLKAGTHRLRARDEGQLQAFWRELWALGHFTLLAYAVAPEQIRGEVARSSDEAIGTKNLHATLFGFLPSVTRGLWAYSRLGTAGVRGAKAFDRTLRAGDWPYGALPCFNAFATGARYAKARAEATKFLHVTAGQPPAPVELLRGELELALTEPALFDPVFHNLAIFSDRPRGEPPLDEDQRALIRATTPVTDAMLARALPRACAMPLHLWTEPELAIGFYPAMVLRVVNAQATDLYAPAADHRPEPWNPKAALELLGSISKTFPLSAPQVRHQTPRVGRNTPCPCGSGRKHKRCCAA